MVSSFPHFADGETESSRHEVKLGFEPMSLQP